MKQRAFSAAWRGYTASFGGTLTFFLVETCLTLICLAPLLCLTDGALAPWAWACPALWLLVMIPARMNAAEAMADALEGGSLGGLRLVSVNRYGEKLLFGLKRLCFLALWGAPLIAMAVIGWNYYSGEVDTFTVLRIIKNDLGGGDQMRGIRVLVIAVLAGLLLLMIGCAFHSGARHARAQGDKNLVRGHHGGVLGTWLASLVCVLPLLIAALILILRYAPALGDLNGLLMKTVTLPSTRGSVLILAAGAVLTLPLLPLRSLLHAAYVRGLKAAGK